MITFEMLKEVNSRVAKIEVKGKPYVSVAARVQAFREICPEGKIETEIVCMDAGVVTMRTTVSDETGKVLATGYAQEKEESSYINKTSYIENCETSAVGRALGMLGIGSEQSMASAEEVANALNQQSSISDKEKQVLVCLIEKFGMNVEEIFPKGMDFITKANYVDVLTRLLGANDAGARKNGKSK